MSTNLATQHPKAEGENIGAITELEMLRKMRDPFPENQVSKLPKPTKAQTEAVKQDYKKGIRCKLCGTWHHPDVVHLDYVGHAALTDRLLDCDPAWRWEPIAFDERGFPRLDENNGLWIRLTVCGVTRIGYGDAQGKEGGDAMKERIGDALRNAAMRFGAALEYWHKGELHVEAHESDGEGNAAAQRITTEQVANLEALITEVGADLKGFLRYMQCNELAEIRAEEYRKAVAALEAKRKRAGKTNGD